MFSRKPVEASHPAVFLNDIPVASQPLTFFACTWMKN